MKHYEDPIVLKPTMTNSAGLPAPLVKVIEEDIWLYRRRVSVTGLQNPALKRELTLRYGGDIKSDVDDAILRVLGSAVHALLENMGRGDSDFIRELKVATTFGDWQLTGKMDLIEDKTISDFKVTGTYGWIADGGKPKPEHVAQLNMYAELLRRNGYHVEKLVVIYLFRDWSKGKRRSDPKRYPAHPWMPVEVPLWPSSSVCEYIENRLREFETAETETIPKIPTCTDIERWAKPTTYAAMKPGRKTASRVLDTEPEYRNWLTEQKNPSEFTLEVRKGENTRCEEYCDVAVFCPFGRKAKGLDPLPAVNYRGPYIHKVLGHCEWAGCDQMAVNEQHLCGEHLAEYNETEWAKKHKAAIEDEAEAERDNRPATAEECKAETERAFEGHPTPLSEFVPPDDDEEAGSIEPPEGTYMPDAILPCEHCEKKPRGGRILRGGRWICSTCSGGTLDAGKEMHKAEAGSIEPPDAVEVSHREAGLDMKDDRWKCPECGAPEGEMHTDGCPEQNTTLDGMSESPETKDERIRRRFQESGSPLDGPDLLKPSGPGR